MTTVLNRDSIKVKRDLQRRVENWVIDYCNALRKILNSIQSIHIKEILINLLKSQKVIHHIMKSNFKKLKMVLQIYISLIIRLARNILKFLIYSIQRRAIIITALLVIVLEVLQHLLISKLAKFINLHHGKRQQSTSVLI